MDIALYIAVFVASIISVALGFNLEVVQGNIRHIENCREPNAGAAIFPTIPVILIVYLLTAWGLNNVIENMGFYLIGLYFILTVIYKSVAIKKCSKRLNGLKSNS
jgi:hypothetical protein